MRLLLATDEYLPHPGGSTRVILETSRRLQARGHQVSILTFERDTSLPLQDEVANVPVHRLPLGGKLSAYPRALLSSRRAFHEQVPKGTYDLLHVHLPLIGLGALLGSNAHRAPRVYTFYGPWHQEMAVELRAKPLRPPVRALYGLYVSLLCRGLQWWQGQVMRRCDRVTVLSEHSRQQISDLFPSISQSRIVLIPGGVDVERFCPVQDQTAVRAGLGLPPNRMLLFTMRRLVPRMGVENLLRAFAQLSGERSDLYLVIGGRGRLEKALHGLAGQLGIAGRVRFTGFIPEEDLPAYYQAADLFVLPTLALEGFGLITLEALACGTPVVGTPVGSTVELLEAFEPRFLAEGVDPESLSRAVLRALDLLGETGWQQRCRDFAARYDWELIVDRYEQLYTDLVSGA